LDAARTFCGLASEVPVFTHWMRAARAVRW
jgi:hypothetical protein